MEILGIDIGGSGIKGAPVDTETGALLAPRMRVPTPKLAKPRQVAGAVDQIVKHFDWHDLVGCGFPAAIRSGIPLTAANIHKKWVGKDAAALFREATACPVNVVNDADAAGLAEIAFGAGQGHNGVVLIVTIGTGLGTSIFINGHILPNTEFGHIEIDGQEAESRASDAARKREKLSWKKWSKRLNRYLQTMERLFWPDLIILGGGVSKKYEQFIPRLNLQADVLPAKLLNEAGIVGAALAARILTDGS